MKRLTPMEIYNKDFKSARVRGYDKDDVNQFLDLIIQNYEDLIHENEQIKEQLKKANRKEGAKVATSSPTGLDMSAYEEALEELLVRIERIEKMIL